MMMGNERPCDFCVLLDSAILAYTLLKVEFFIRPVNSPKHNSLILVTLLPDCLARGRLGASSFLHVISNLI